MHQLWKPNRIFPLRILYPRQAEIVLWLNRLCNDLWKSWCVQSVAKVYVALKQEIHKGMNLQLIFTLLFPPVGMFAKIYCSHFECNDSNLPCTYPSLLSSLQWVGTPTSSPSSSSVVSWWPLWEVCCLTATRWPRDGVQISTVSTMAIYNCYPLLQCDLGSTLIIVNVRISLFIL